MKYVPCDTHKIFMSVPLHRMWQPWDWVEIHHITMFNAS